MKKGFVTEETSLFPAFLTIKHCQVYQSTSSLLLQIFKANGLPFSKLRGDMQYD